MTRQECNSGMLSKESDGFPYVCQQGWSIVSVYPVHRTPKEIKSRVAKMSEQNLYNLREHRNT